MKSTKQKARAVEEEQNNKAKNADGKRDSKGKSSNPDQGEKEPDMNMEENVKNNGENEIDKASEKELQLQEKLAEMQDKYLRLSAEFDNYRRRTLKEKMELTKYANEEILLKTIPFKDDFERALSAMESSKDVEVLRLGVVLIYNKFSEFLKQHGITEIEALGCPFDLDVHDAVAKMQVNEEEKKGKIVEVIQKGYFLQDKVIRHSKVIVGE